MHFWKNPSYSHYARICQIGLSEKDESLFGWNIAPGNHFILLSCREDCMGAAMAELLVVANEIRTHSDGGRLVMVAQLAVNDLPTLVHGLTQRGLLSLVEFAAVKLALGEIGKDLNWNEEAANWRGMDI